jgi:hypothetical protein
MLYIKPSKEFAEYAEKNNYYVLVTISGTEMYDGEVTGIINSSGYYPNFRPNFYNDTEYYTITIMNEWRGYPTNPGIVLIQGIEGPDTVTAPPPIPFQVPKPIEWYEPDCPKNILPKQMAGILIVLSGVLIILCALAQKR